MFLVNKRKYQKFYINPKNQGFTIIEALVTLFIFSLITMTFYSVFSLGSSYIIESKNRLGAVALANEKMEIIRNLKYDDIGIIAGIPSGSIAAEEYVTESKHTYHVKTFIQFIDDPFDGISPTDLNPSDYKRVKVTISWKGVKGVDSSFFLVARFVPPGIEQNSTGGILSVNIIGSNGIGVPQASVHITNTAVSPNINITAMTDNTGNLMLPGAPQSTQGYNITITKNGYEAVDTIDPNSVTYSVTDTPASVVEGMLNMKIVIENKVADLKITAVDYLGTLLPNVNFRIEGGRILGYDEMYVPATPTYNLISNETTDASGEVKLDNISPGQFSISAIEATLEHTLINLESDALSSFDPATGAGALSISPGDSKEVKIKFANNNDNSLLLNITKLEDDSPLFGALVELSNASGYSENFTTLADGVAFFPRVVSQLAAGTYDLKITLDGYNEYNSTVEINKLTIKQIKLISN